MSKKWALLTATAMIIALISAPGIGLAAEEEEGGNNLSTPVIFAEGYGLSGFQVDPSDITSTGMPGLLKPVCGGVESWSAGSDTVTFPAGTSADFALSINGTIYAEIDGASTASPGNYFLQPKSLVPLAGGDSDQFGFETCWEADWADGSVMDIVEADTVDVGDSLVRVLRKEGPSPIRVEFTMFQTTETAGTFQDGLALEGYPMTQLWPPGVLEGKPPSAGGGEKIEVWATADNGGAGTKTPADMASVYTRNARLTIDKLTWAVVPDSVSDGDLSGYPSGVIPNTLDPAYDDWVASVVYDGVVGGSGGSGGFSSEVNQSGRVLYGYNWTNATEGWYRITLSIDGQVGGIAANAAITGVNPADQAADETGETAALTPDANGGGGSSDASKAFFPPTFVEDSTNGSYLFLDVYIAGTGTTGSGKMNGKVTKPGGAGIGDAEVTVYNLLGDPVGMDVTAADGSFDFNIKPGTYNVGFADTKGVHLPEFYNNKKTMAAADDVAVVSGQTTTLLATLEPRTVPTLSTGFGIVDTRTGIWYLREPVNGDTTNFYYGNPGDVPFVGDWDGDGDETPGLYRQSDGYVYLRNSNTQGVADIKFFFGNPGDIPLAGDFNGDGFDTVSIYRPSEGKVYIINKLGSADKGLGAAEYSFYFGNPGDKPFVGDFNNNGIDTIGLHRESTGLVYLRMTNTQGIADLSFIYGNPGDKIMAGDWNGNGIDTVGLFRPSNSMVFLRYTNTQGIADVTIPYGVPSGLPVAGDFGYLPGGGTPPGS